MFDLGIKVLIVDDMKTMRKLVIRSCQEMGFKNFVEAQDGQEAWAILNSPENQVQLVISDWNMPNCTGLDLLKRVRADGRLKELPFILLTAESEAAQVATAIQAGVDNYLVKPFQTASLKQKLEVVAKKRGKVAA